MATIPYLDEPADEVDGPLYLVHYPSDDELAASTAVEDVYLTRPVDYAWAVFLLGLALGWIAAMFLIAYHIATVGL